MAKPNLLKQKKIKKLLAKEEINEEIKKLRSMKSELKKTKEQIESYKKYSKNIPYRKYCRC